MPTSAQQADVPRPDDRARVAGSRRRIWLAAACLLGAVFAAYRNSLPVPFVFDDVAAVLDNPSIRHLSDIGAVLSPPTANGQTVGGRPLVNLSLAVNYAIGRESAWGYHVFNVAVHALGALALFGVTRRTLRQPVLRARFGSAATPLGLAIAVLWSVHPLQTESVTYVIQRAESLMGLFFLLTLYGFIRGTEPGRRAAGWLAFASVTCVLGMATKEVMATAPLLVLLYDHTFVAGTWRDAWAKRKLFYVSLGASWLLLGWLVLGADNRGGTAGLGVNDSSWTYALTQTRAIVTYLQLALWPFPLVFDYGTDLIEHVAEALPFAVIVLALVGGVVVALWRWPAVGYVGAWFFVILAPSSSIVPIPVQPMAEHRMYLPLAAIAALTVAGAYLLWRRAWWLVAASVTIALLALTVARNNAYIRPGAIWVDTLAKRPGNTRALCFYGDVLAAKGRPADALAQYEEALQLEQLPAQRGGRSIVTDLLVNSGNVLRALGRETEAATRYEEALRLDPGLAAAHYNLGTIDLKADRLREAIARFERALAIDPRYPAAHTSLGSALLLSGRTEAALAHYEAALRLDPSAKSHQNLGVALVYVRRLPEAVGHLEQAVRLDPDSAKVHGFLGDALTAQGRAVEAARHYERALQLEPGNERVRRALEQLRAAPR